MQLMHINLLQSLLFVPMDLYQIYGSPDKALSFYDDIKHFNVFTYMFLQPFVSMYTAAIVVYKIITQ